MTQITAVVEQIGPKEADAYLMKHKLNRPVQRSHVITLARQMSQGQWRFTGQAIIFDVNDDLLNGQHSLRAVVHSGTTQQFLVVRGVPTVAFDVMDTGRKRSYKDTLYIAGFPQPNLYGGLANKLIRWERMIYFGGPKYTALAPTNQEIVDYCEAHRKELAETINYGLQVQDQRKETKIMGAGTFTFLYHLFKQSNKSQAFDFCDRLLSGHDVDKVAKYQPIAKLRQRLLHNLEDDAKLPTRLVVLMTVGAWNAYRQNKKLHGLDGTQQLNTAQGKKIKIF